MAIPWLTVLQAVPWSDVISNAPKVAEGARKLWSTVAKKPPSGASEAPDAPPDTALSPNEQALLALENRLAAVEASASQMHEQLLASSALIQALADQNAQLIGRIEANRVKIRWLTFLALIAALAGLVGLGLGWARHLA